MKDAKKRILYIGKAANLRRRVSSYFAPLEIARPKGPEGAQARARFLTGLKRPLDPRIEKLVSLVKKIDYRKTDSALEALILEAELIKKHEPPFNIKEKDDKSFLYVEVTKEKFPRVFMVRGRQGATSKNSVLFGPFVQSSNLREALRIIRKIFPYNTHPPHKIMWGASPSTRLRQGFGGQEKPAKYNRPCFDYQIGLCPGICIGAISREEYLKNVNNLKLFFEGKKNRILGNLKREMSKASKILEFEKAAKIRKQIFALQHIEDTALISNSGFGNWELKIGNSAKRIEGYDVSNISGISAVGAMVVFVNGKPDKNEYRKFKIGTVFGPNDIAMLKEVLVRRLSHREWLLPNLILIDGGKGQVNAVKEVLNEAGLKIPVVGIAKGAKRKKNEFIGKIPEGVEKKTLIKVRDEAHRFAIGYHKQLRRIASFY